MTAAFFAALIVVVVIVAVAAVRERSRRDALELARQQVATATEQADEATRLRRDAEASVEEQIAATASAESRLAELHAMTNRQRGELEHGLRNAEAERLRLEEAAAAQARVTAATSARIADLEAASAASAAARDDAAARVTALEAELEARRARDRGVSKPAADLDAGSVDRRVERNGDLSWRLLLARVERQWADVVNAGPDERGVIDTSQGEQLAQAIARDLERLREEVGVQTTLAPTQPIGDDDPLTTLLAVGEAVALLAYHSEHVGVDLGIPAVVSGEDWTGDDDALGQLERLAATASAGGVPASVAVVDRIARVTLGAQG